MRENLKETEKTAAAEEDNIFMLLRETVLYALNKYIYKHKVAEF